MPRRPSKSRAKGPSAAALELAGQLDLLAKLGGLQSLLGPSRTFAEVWDWWRQSYLATRVDRADFAHLVESDLVPELGQLKAGELRPEHIEAALRKVEARGCGPRTVNGRRSAIKRILRDAAANGLWWGPEVCAAVRLRPVPRRHWPTLSIAEGAELLYTSAPPWRAIWALSLYLGLRKGETFALRRSAVLFEDGEGVLVVERSHERQTTKTGRSRSLPITDWLRPYLLEQLRHVEDAPDALLFAGPGGGMRRRDSKLSARLRAALKRAGICEGFNYRCRRCMGPHYFSRVKLFAARCPHCDKLLWESAVPRRLRAYDLRHTFTTRALEAGVPREVVQMVMGHAGDTTSLYTQRTMREVREHMKKLRYEKSEAPPAATGEASNKSPGEDRTTERETRLELATLSLGNNRPANPPTMDFGGHLVELPAFRMECEKCRRIPAEVVIDGNPLCTDCGNEWFTNHKARAGKAGPR